MQNYYATHISSAFNSEMKVFQDFPTATYISESAEGKGQSSSKSILPVSTTLVLEHCVQYEQ